MDIPFEEETTAPQARNIQFENYVWTVCLAYGLAWKGPPISQM